MQKQSLFGYYKKGFSDTFVQRERKKETQQESDNTKSVKTP